MDVVIVTVEGVTETGEIIASEVSVVTDDPTTDVDDIVEYYRRRLPLTVEAMGL